MSAIGNASHGQVKLHSAVHVCQFLCLNLTDLCVVPFGVIVRMSHVVYSVRHILYTESRPFVQMVIIKYSGNNV